MYINLFKIDTKVETFDTKQIGGWIMTFLIATFILTVGMKSTPPAAIAAQSSINEPYGTIDSVLITVADHMVARNGFIKWSNDTLYWKHSSTLVRLYWEDGYVNMDPKNFEEIDQELQFREKMSNEVEAKPIVGPVNWPMWEDQLHDVLLDWVCKYFPAEGSYGLENGIVGKRSGTEVQDMMVGITEGQFQKSIAYNAIKMSIRDTTPASIKVAQWILETGYCTSTICVLANAGYGVKYQRINPYKKGADVWIYPRNKQDWDHQEKYSWKIIGKETNDSFTVGEDYIVSYDSKERSYAPYRTFTSPINSMQQHSNLLKKKRYRWMKEKYPKSAYKKWAWGLKRSGYATDSEYARSLIRVIETYNLTFLDQFTGHQSMQDGVLAYLNTDSNYLNAD